MSNKKTWDLIIIGGGLSGLTCALHLSKYDYKVLLIEKQEYPNHKVCGEYVSNEVLPYLNFLGLDPLKDGAKNITQFEMSNTRGSCIQTTLPLGGFGISRYLFDNLFYNLIKNSVDIEFDVAETIDFSEDIFTIQTKSKKVFSSNYVVGAFGKRSNLDTFMKRKFIQKKSPWLAIKAHYEYDFPDNKVALHNFEGGYCGLSKTETNAVNACYLTTYKSFKRFGDIDVFQQYTMSKNPYLKDFFENSNLLFDKPLTISQVSFDEKKPVENHIFMIGDSAGLIHPLCGNGMAMAIHSAKIFSETFVSVHKNGGDIRTRLEQEYTQKWEDTFLKRLKAGRWIQNLLLHKAATYIGFSAIKIFPNMLPAIIKKTHGSPLQ